MEIKRKYSQGKEERIIRRFFNDMSKGTVVDVGAADGEINSNSRFLIERLGWQGVLVEPNPEFYQKLSLLYGKNENITIMNNAVYNESGTIPFYMYGEGDTMQASTLSNKFKKRVEEKHGDKYRTPIDVSCIGLDVVLSKAKFNWQRPQNNIDFLTIDCEGVDMEVLESNNWNKHRANLVCIEKSMEKKVLNKYMAKQKYSFITESNENMFYVNDLMWKDINK